MMKTRLVLASMIGAVVMPLLAEDDIYEQIRQQKEALFLASLAARGEAPAAVAGGTESYATRGRTLLGDAQTTSPSLTITEVKQREGTYGSGAIVDVTYNLSDTERQCNVTAQMLTNGSVVVSAPTIDQSGDYGAGVQPGDGKKFSWLAGLDWPNGYSENFRIDLTATEMSVPAAWATVTISWQNYDGGRDLDICAFWEDEPGNKVGYNYISSSSSGYQTLKWPTGDNTSTGPEQVYCNAAEYCAATGQESRRLRIHFNYYNTPGDPPKVDVFAKGGNIEPMRKLRLSAGTNRGRAATTSDPGVVITFDASNTPISID